MQVAETVAAAEEGPAAHAESLPPQEGSVALAAGVTGQEIVSEAVDKAVAAMSDEGPEDDPVPGEEPRQQGTIAPGWEALIDPSSGKEYFYNSDTGETAWEMPVKHEESLAPKESERPEENQDMNGGDSTSPPAKGSSVILAGGGRSQQH